ncbi:hypothetical protein Nepgr_002199 [Nepenthes gracilis]|uniref:LHY n=1 Tax=Nepenthes gracilis TaxID=150966 RepID=A0AAD3P3I3_NEPGR|nr:hypothetical protein Nepgr_002199 [Nepenthes gracilis]
MDAYSSGEELVVKTRKPYTITKQRERWSEEEHNRFLEALKLYGRAWQRIEDHIGTKTAVQIRSHAQKFFSKLEKEALVKGIPIGEAIDIDIPPPRPKRKPSNPYPRKSGDVGATTAQVGLKDGKQEISVSSHPCRRVIDLEKETLPEKRARAGPQENTKEKHHDGECSKAFDTFQGSQFNLVSSAGKNSVPTTEAVSKSCNFTECVPIGKHVTNQGKSIEPHIADEPTVNDKSNGSDTVETVQTNGTENVIQSSKSFPRHVPVHILDGSLQRCCQALSSDVSYQESLVQQVGNHSHPALFTNPAASATLESQNSTSRSITLPKFTSYHPPFIMPFTNSQEDYCSFLQMSSTFSSLIVSTLLQNPAAHAAASISASFWSSPNVGSSADAPTASVEGFPSRQMSPAPSIAALAAATVAAATAWWAAHGLLPLDPFHSGFNCAPVGIATAPTNADRTPAIQKEKENDDFQKQGQQLHHEISGVLQGQHLDPKSPAISSSDSGDSLVAEMNNKATATDQNKKVPAVNEPNDSTQGKNEKQLDRSSCGSNTGSSSDVETDALQKHEKSKEGSIKIHLPPPAGESSNRRSRNAGTINDSWREVSEEGRMAFQALFLREVLPQSFPAPHYDVNKKDHENINVNENGRNPEESNENASQLDLNRYTRESCSSHQVLEKNGPSDEDPRKEGLLTIALAQGKLKARRTGFKPYKRCSVEVRDSRVANTSSQDQENSPKRLRLQGEAST